MDGLAGALTGVAATLAAILSWANLYVSGRRDQAKWQREALLQAYDDYLSLSRKRDHVADKIARLRVAGDTRTPQDLRDEEADLHEKQLDVLTRLRLLSTQGIVEAAEAVHLADHQLIEAASSVSRNQDPSTYGDARRVNGTAKTRLLDEIRKSLGLPADTRIGQGM